MFRRTLITTAAVALLAGPALAKDDLPNELQRPQITTSSVQGHSVPAFLQGKIFVQPRSDQNESPFAARQTDPLTTSSVKGYSVSAPVARQGKVFVHPNSDANDLPYELRRVTGSQF